MKRSPLARGTSQLARTPMPARTSPMPRTVPGSSPAPRRAVAASRKVRDTGPDRATRLLVLERDGYACVSCGKHIGDGHTWWSLQHRVARGQGGSNETSNLIVLCGSATSDGCHRTAEDRDRESRAKGYWLESWQDPAAEPVMLFSEHRSGVTVWLTDDGEYSLAPPAEVA